MMTARSKFGPKPRPEIEARKEEIRLRSAAGETLMSIARSLGLSHQSVSQVVNAGHFWARQRVRDAVKVGRLVRPDSCQRCGKAARVQAHHHDYSLPLEVEWVCSDCHALEHYGAVAERNELIRIASQQGAGARTLAKQFGISRTLVRRILDAQERLS